MESFELKTMVAAPPSQVYAAITDPRYITKWDYCSWAQNDYRLGGVLRKRDGDKRLVLAEIVVLDPPYRFAIVTPILMNPEEPDEGEFLTRQEFSVEAHEDKSLLTLKVAGFPSEELATRERNSWGGYFLEKLKKVAEGIRVAK